MRRQAANSFSKVHGRYYVSRSSSIRCCSAGGRRDPHTEHWRGHPSHSESGSVVPLTKNLGVPSSCVRGRYMCLRSGAGSDGNIYSVLCGLSDFWQPSGPQRPSFASSGRTLGAVRGGMMCVPGRARGVSSSWDAYPAWRDRTTARVVTAPGSWRGLSSW